MIVVKKKKIPTVVELYSIVEKCPWQLLKFMYFYFYCDIAQLALC